MSHALRIKQLRKAVGVSQIQAAVGAGVSPVTWRLFEANPEVLSQEMRDRCERQERELVQRAAERVA